MRARPHAPYYYSLRCPRPGGGGGSRGWLPPRAAPPKDKRGAAPAGLQEPEVRAGHLGAELTWSWRPLRQPTCPEARSPGRYGAFEPRPPL